MKFGLLLFIAIVGLVNCRHPSGESSAEVREFQPLKASQSTLAPNIQLNFVSGITYRIYRDLYDWGRGGDDYHTRVEFANLDQEQFEYLKRTYGFGLSQVMFKPGEIYELRDFLTPMMQAVLNQRFRAEINENYIHVTTNCWSTAYEALRSARVNARSFTFFVQEAAEPMRNAFAQAATTSQPLIKTRDLKDVSRFAALSFGDVILQYDDQGSMEHAAVVVDRDLFFEKTAIITESPYRLVHVDDWAYPIPEGGYVELWRINRDKMKAPVELFKSTGLKQTGSRIEKGEFPLLETEIGWHTENLGRARLDERAFRPLVLKRPPGYL